jgi:hypothetical protein
MWLGQVELIGESVVCMAMADALPVSAFCFPKKGASLPPKKSYSDSVM